MVRWLFCYCLLLAGLGAIPAKAQGVPDLSALDPIIERAAFAMRGDLELVVMHHGAVVYRKATEGHGGVGSPAIASASKWLTAATVQSMVDEGLLSWDDPAGLHLYYFRDDKAPITLRQIFSHTSGIRADFHCLDEAAKTADNCIQEISRTPLLYPPATAFHYGDAAMRASARVAEVVSGRFWEDLFRQRIAQPLGMASTTFQPGGPLLNPDVAAGAWSATDDYLHFLEMLVARGTWGGMRILSRRGVDLMLADQTRGARIASSFYAADDAVHPGAGVNRYGLGNWLEGMTDGVSDANSSQGAYGVSPYIDRRRGYSFLIFQRNSGSGFNRFYYEIQDALNAAFPVESVPLTAKFEETERASPSRIGAPHRAFRYLPDACRERGSECPALVALSPSASSGLAFAEQAGLAEFAERERVVVEVWEAGTAGSEGSTGQESFAAWNLEPDFGLSRPNDSQLPFEANADLVRQPGVDARRIYLLGVRQGADVAALAACQAPDAFAGVVLVDPAIGLKAAGEDEAEIRVCEHPGRVPVMIWGSAPAAADAEPRPLSAAAAQAQFWAARQRCAGEAESEWRRQTASWRVTDWSGCEAGSQVRFAALPQTVQGWPAGGIEVAWEFLRGFDDGIRARGSAVQTNAASFLRRHTSAGSLASVFGDGLARETAYAAGPGLPAVLAGVRVEIRDPGGKTLNAGLVFVSPGQINLLIPEGLAAGIASLFLYDGQQLTHKDWLYIDPSAPGLFAASAAGSGAPAGEALYVRANGAREATPLARLVEDGPDGPAWTPNTILWGEPGVEIYLTLYGTGWSSGEPEGVYVMLGDTRIAPEYAGRQGGFAGLDQVNVRLDTLPGAVVDRLADRAAPIAVCTPDACSERLEVRIEKSSNAMAAP